ncbi:hypothetical protein RJ55_07302 [Drechmeria coniospora]|nr:hypothetical protein RJ55_07302 [Drechmeria coniospora]
MPYTPPSHRSPASSAPTSPDASRRSSFQTAERPSLPRSASYLSKHRRTPSVTPVDEAAVTHAHVALGRSVRQSPPLPLDNGQLIPKGAIVSPPESATSGSDDEAPPAVEGPEAVKVKDLRAVVTLMPLPLTDESVDGLRSPSAVRPPGLRPRFAPDSLPLISSRRRKQGHVRSATDSAITAPKSAGNSVSCSDDDMDDDLKYEPQMVRKKSGELVRPALRASRRRPASMPGTPVFSKAVHFDSHLEHVRHFLQVDRPLAVSAGSSPVESHDSDGEYPFPADGKPEVRSPPFEWDLVTSNFPHDARAREGMPVRLERVWLSPDQKQLLGSVAVANLAFQKHVACRFTLDYWKTVSEVAAEFSHDIRARAADSSSDRFTFAIKLSDMANLESKTLFFCVRYCVGGREFWDNNGSINFQVDFRKKHLPQNGRNHFQGAASQPPLSLPRSSRRPSPGRSALRPTSVPASLDALCGEPDKLGLEGPMLRLKTKSSRNLASDLVSQTLKLPSGVAFSNRYDFGASLSAAMQVAKDSMAKDKDALYMKRNVRGLGTRPADSPASPAHSSSTDSCSPSSLGLPSASYEELVDKYCFFGSKQSSPTVKEASLNGVASDKAKAAAAAEDDEEKLSSETRTTAVHHSIRIHEPSGYTLAASPASTAQSTPGNERDQLTIPRRPRSTSPALASGTEAPSSRPRSTPPALASGAGSAPGEVPFLGPMSDRFPWTADSQPATAIRG